MSISLLPSIAAAHGNVTLITEQLDSPAEFLLHRALTSVLKEGIPCILVSSWNDLMHWSTIQSRSNFSLSAQIASKRLTFVDVPALLESLDGDTTRLLRDLFNQISDTLALHTAPTSKHVCVMIEDLSHLSWIGATDIEVSRFYRALRAVCLKVGASLILISRVLGSKPPENILRDLLANCHAVINVLPLSSGRSGSVSGEITTRPGPWDVELTISVTTKKTALQYRLTDSGAVFFQKGTAGGVL